MISKTIFYTKLQAPKHRCTKNKEQTCMFLHFPTMSSQLVALLKRKKKKNKQQIEILKNT
jgi:hypothetical protein